MGTVIDFVSRKQLRIALESTYVNGAWSMLTMTFVSRPQESECPVCGVVSVREDLGRGDLMCSHCWYVEKT